MCTEVGVTGTVQAREMMAPPRRSGASVRSPCTDVSNRSSPPVQWCPTHCVKKSGSVVADDSLVSLSDFAFSMELESEGMVSFITYKSVPNIGSKALEYSKDRLRTESSRGFAAIQRLK